jgi:hypothetical protein
MQLKEELVEAKGIGRIFDDSDKNRNHIGWLGTMAQTYLPRFFTPDDDDDDDEEDDDEEDDGEGGDIDVDVKNGGKEKKSEVQQSAPQKPAASTDAGSSGRTSDEKKSD